MSRSLCVLISLVFVLAAGLSGVARGAVDPDLVGWWWFEEASGTAASDSSTYGNHGTLMGGAGWAPGYFRTALELDGVDGYVEVPHNDTLNTDDEATVMAWINTPRLETPGQGYQGVIGKGNGTARSYSLYTTPSGMHFSTGPSGAYIGSSSSSGALPTNEWVHVCAMIVDNGHAYFVNGEPAGTGGAGAVGPGAADTESVVIGRTHEGTNRSFEGLIDDARIYVRGLTQAEIQAIMTGADLATTAASSPIPGDGQTDVRPDTALSWTAGEYAATHDVYLGMVFDDVNDASQANPMGLLVGQGQTPTTYDPPGLLDIDQTYFWRIDEVNATPDNTIFKGTVWSFTTEPLAYAVEGITVTSNTVANGNQVPENVVNGSGLNEDDQHSDDTAAMWAGALPEGEDPSIQFDFDKVYKLHEMLVWNYNMAFEMFLGVGCKDVTVEYSQDGENWVVLGDVVFAQGPGANAYTANTTVAFDAVAVKHVRFTINSAYGTSSGLVGLSEVRFMYIPAHAREPQPADGAVDIALDTVLNWRGGRGAVSRDVYLGTDPNALVLAGTTTETSYNPGVLDLDSPYYWQVDENDGTATWAGDTWNFSTQEYIEVDGFETYDDVIETGTTIWQTWIDGIDDPTHGGAIVGNATSPFAEQTIVHTGSQSLNLFYTNANASAISEADRTLTPAQNWAANGVKSLSLWFHGAAGNSGRLYVKINGTKIPYDGDAGDIAREAWQPFNIDLTTAGVNVSNVTVVTVGVDGAGSGVVYIDDIRLYAKTPELIIPVEADAANLVAHYTLDDGAGTTAADSSGNGNHGALQGDPQWVVGMVAGALELDGNGDFVDCGNDAIFDITDQLSLAVWVNANDMLNSEHNCWMGKGDNAFAIKHQAGNWLEFVVYDGGWHVARYDTNLDALNGEWHHMAGTYDGTELLFYLDGQEVGSQALSTTIDVSTDNVTLGENSQATGRYFDGMLDDARIYSRPLSPAEVAGLAGRTAPLHVPF